MKIVAWHAEKDNHAVERKLENDRHARERKKTGGLARIGPVCGSCYFGPVLATVGPRK